VKSRTQKKESSNDLKEEERPRVGEEKSWGKIEAERKKRAFNLGLKKKSARVSQGAWCTRK